MKETFRATSGVGGDIVSEEIGAKATVSGDVKESVCNEEQNMILLGDDLFSAPKTSWSFSNSNLRHLWHSSSDSDHLRVPETLWSTSYSEPLPTVPNTTVHSLHSNPSSNTPSKDYSETSTSSKGSSETSLDSIPSDPNSALTFLRDSPSHSRDKAAPTASDIKGQVIKVIHDVKGRWWSGLMGNAGRWP